jgi:hypothetical protein
MYSGISESIVAIMSAGKFTPIKVEPPTKPGTEDFGEMSKELKTLYTLIEFYANEEGRELKKKKENRDPIFLAELKAKREIVIIHFNLEFFKMYKENVSETFTHYCDWHVYRVPFLLD